MQKIPFNLSEVDGTGKVSGKIHIGDEGLAIFIDGYGEKTSTKGGSIITIEKWEGHLRIAIWDDIQTEEAQIIDLEGASESRRLPN